MGSKCKSRSLLAVTLAASGAVAVSSDAQSKIDQPAPPTVHSNKAPPVNGYSFGYGTYYVANHMNVPPNWGDAKYWYARAKAAGYQVGSTPKKGSIAWNSGGAHGRVAIVEYVTPDGKYITISEMNGRDGWNRVTIDEVPARLFKYIY